MSDQKSSFYQDFERINQIAPEFYDRFDVKRGLRNADGTGVIAGLTNICNVHGYMISDGEVCPDQGRLTLRGYEIEDLVSPAVKGQRYCFEGLCYLLFNGKLPTESELAEFIALIDAQRELPDGFTAHNIMDPATADICNCLARSVLMLYAKDPDAESRNIAHEISTAISLISRLPRIAVLAHFAKQAAFSGGSMIMHRFVPGQSTAETILSMLRSNREYTAAEAQMLDIMLTLHAEHGGGNNSTFAIRVVTSADTDPYSAYAAAIGSLKGSRHGGANAKVMAMQEDIKAHVSNWENDDELASYLTKLVNKQGFDGSGLIYGMGHAVYTISDPRAVICQKFAEQLAANTKYEAELKLLQSIERLTPQVFADVKGSTKPLCANIDMYSGFIYTMLGIPEDLFTPLFVCSRMSGWAAHRFEEIVSGKRIMRPAYKSTSPVVEYLPREKR
ncbi:MAG: citrate/2-methylcitrate synthase [Actinomycetia bacterium]|nr:citrate/2-methylcitrate synthase [Actinomycetes bacterium]